MYRGAFEPLPAPLGGDGGLEGVNAAQWGRITCDVTSAWRSVPLAIVRIDGSTGALKSSLTRWGCGINHEFAPTTEKDTTGVYIVTLDNAYEDELGNVHPINVRTATATANLTLRSAFVTSINANRVNVKTFLLSTGNASNCDVTVIIYGDWGPDRTISDYGGALDKRDDENEHPVPYAAQIYGDLKLQRGSAYTDKTASFVHAENLATARLWASAGWRLPEKFRNNAIGPKKADEGLDYWAKAFGLGQRPGESRAALRARLALHKRPGVGATYNNLVDEVSTLIGDAFVGITLNFDDQFETPPANTYWPVINPGPDTFDLGPGAWLSERQQVIINAEQPPGMTDGEFNQKMNVELFELVNRLLPVWCTAQWQDSGATRVVWDGAGITWDGGAEWSNLFDWNS